MVLPLKSDIDAVVFDLDGAIGVDRAARADALRAYGAAIVVADLDELKKGA